MGSFFSSAHGVDGASLFKASAPAASTATQAPGAAVRGAMLKKGGVSGLGADSTIATSPLGTSEPLGGTAQASLLGSS